MTVSGDTDEGDLGTHGDSVDGCPQSSDDLAATVTSKCSHIGHNDSMFWQCVKISMYLFMLNKE